ncbi:unnamed protein product [Rotaria sp. Silwood2]|nr:unnamed protein product [Rotaria sp. Silwood2]CAF3919724.1 unnamed protein product [Rotaria sp. Silwood2]
MSRRVRTTTTSGISSISSSKSKKISIPIRKLTHNVIQKKTSVKKSSSTKRYLDQSSSTIIQPRQKRLSSLTATALLQYCTSILSPSRKLNRSIKSTSTLSNNSKTNKTKQLSIENKHIPRKRQISNVSSKSDIKLTQTDTHMPIRMRREASSRASAMIMQQNEIERSRYNYSLINKNSTSIIRRHRTNKVDIPSKQPSIQLNSSNIPSHPIPTSIIDIPIQIEYSQSSNNSLQPLSSTNLKYPLLTEAILAEHNRLYETIPIYHTTKRDNLIKWTQEIDLHERLSPPLPYSEHEIPIESSNHYNSINNKSTVSLIPDSKIIDSMTLNTSTHSLEHLSTRNNINNNPNFLFSSAAYSLDLHSFYPILPCWQYSTWPYHSSTSLHHQIQSSSSLINQKTSVIHSENRLKQLSIFDSKEKQEELLLSKNDRLTFHLHTHHHHHIHNNTNSSSQKSSSLINKKQYQEIETILNSNNNNNNLIEKESQHISSTIENNILNLSINKETIKKTTRRKSSPIKRHINSGTKSNSSSSSSICDNIPQINNSMITIPEKIINNNPSRIILSPSNNLNLNDNSSIGNKKTSECIISKRRTISSTTANSITNISIADEKRTHSVSNISLRSKSSINKKRSYSPTLSLSNKNSVQRKKQKISNYWILFGKSEQKLVSIHSDKPPVIRECYSSIQHITEKDIINSNDCVILRPETDTENNDIPYVAKVKWFWKEPTSDEIQMSLIWYYHPEHTELPARAKQRFLQNELLASRYSDCINVACIEDKCYVLNLNEYSRYCLREKSTNLFEHSEPVGQLKLLLNRNTPTVYHRLLPATTVGNQNIFFCRHVYDYRVKRILKNPSLNNLNSYPMTTTISSTTTLSM